ncbi:MAG TPA: hypothetical protein VGO89_09255, partial [Streptomyces sp.]|nr:hypothetical protein [Streptomyces sp.]
MNTSSVTDRTVDLAADGDGAASRHRRPLRTEAWKGSWGVLITVAMVCPSLIQLLNTRDYIAVSWVWTHDALR